jgi:hypothetical protein
MLRLDVDNGTPYGIPPTNPFVGVDGLDEIWAYGLRNPWRWSFDRLTGDLWIGDVGQNKWEELDFQAASSSGGENYGWRCYEGNHTYNTSLCDLSASYVFPIFEYPITSIPADLQKLEGMFTADRNFRICTALTLNATM